MSIVDKYIGQRFGKLIILREGDRFMQPSGQSQRGAVCLCDCGNKKNIRLVHVTSGRVSSCNCNGHGNDKGYYPDNCRFVTQMENCNNRRCTTTVMYKGKKQSFSLLLHKQGKHNHYGAIRDRIGRGWEPERAIDTPIRKGNYIKKYNST